MPATAGASALSSKVAQIPFESIDPSVTALLDVTAEKDELSSDSSSFTSIFTDPLNVSPSAPISNRINAPSKN